MSTPGISPTAVVASAATAGKVRSPTSDPHRTQSEQDSLRDQHGGQAGEEITQRGLRAIGRLSSRCRKDLWPVTDLQDETGQQGRRQQRDEHVEGHRREHRQGHCPGQRRDR